MKKILLATMALLGTFIITNLSAQAYNYLGPTNEANRNFQPIMQHRFEKEETMDFVKDPDQYKIKREKKDAYLDYKEGKTTEIPEFMKPKININSTQKPATNMEFTKGNDGQIHIQSIR
ncbi:MAG: hypothetical protein E7Z87_07225 [Cyanobacteria bacterium SIG26]|nr:hypothetical protein [Cyanobacteria bacterium SIG26]